MSAQFTERSDVKLPARIYPEESRPALDGADLKPREACSGKKPRPRDDEGSTNFRGDDHV